MFGLNFCLSPVFVPSLDNAFGEPATIVFDNNEAEFGVGTATESLPSKSEFGELNTRIDLTGGVAGDLSIQFEFNESPASERINPDGVIGYRLADITDNLPAIENVSIVESASTIGSSASDITFDDDSISVILPDSSVRTDNTLLLDVDLADV